MDEEELLEELSEEEREMIDQRLDDEEIDAEEAGFLKGYFEEED